MEKEVWPHTPRDLRKGDRFIAELDESGTERTAAEIYEGREGRWIEGSNGVERLYRFTERIRVTVRAATEGDPGA
jgi:hypothetical protein